MVEKTDVIPIANAACERKDASFQLARMIVPGARDPWYVKTTDV